MNTTVTMSIDEIIQRVTAICRQYHVEHLSLFGSFAKNTATSRSDIDFIVYGCKDIENLLEEIDDIPTLRKIDIFNYDEVCNEYLRKDMDLYGKKIY